MVIDDLNYLLLVDADRTRKLQGGLLVEVEVHAYASLNFSAATVNANAVGQITRTTTNTKAKVYEGTYSGYSSAYAQGTASASNGQTTYTTKVIERKSYYH